MEAILAGGRVTAMTAGHLALGCAKRPNTASGLAGWLAIARSTKIELWLEITTSGSDSHALTMVAETVVDGRVLALVACPRASGRGDDVLVVTDIRHWELVRLNCEHQHPIPRRESTTFQLSVIASGNLAPSTPRDISFARSPSARAELPIAVRGPARDDAVGRDTRENGGSKTLAACASDGAVTLLIFSHDTDGGLGEEMSGKRISNNFTTSVIFPLTSEIIGSSRPMSGKRTNSSINVGIEAGEQQQEDSLLESVYVSVVSDITIFGGESCESTDSAGPVNPHGIIALLLVDEPRGGGSRKDRVVGRHCTRLQTCRWKLGRGGSFLEPFWRLLHLHPDTCIAAFAEGGVLCANPIGVQAFNVDGSPLLNVGESPQKHPLGIAIPRSAITLWGADVHPTHLKRVGNDSRVSCDRIEEFLLADRDGEFYRISVFMNGSSHTSYAGTCHKEQDTSNGNHIRRHPRPRIQCKKLEIRAELASSYSSHKHHSLLPARFGGLVFATAHSNCFPLIVRIALTSSPADGDSAGGGQLFGKSNVKGGPVAAHEAQAATVSWEILKGARGMPDSWGFGPVCGMAVLPDFKGEGRGAKLFPSSVDKTVRQPRQGGLLPSGKASGDALRGKTMMREYGRRLVLATGTTGYTDCKNPDPAAGLCILEQGFALDAEAEGNIGLPQGATLFAQPIAQQEANTSTQRQRGQPNFDEVDDAEARPGIYETTGRGQAKPGRHLLLLSDRARSKTHVMMLSSGQEAVPVDTVAEKGFDVNLHTVHLGRTEPAGSMIQVTEQGVNIIQPAAESRVFETIASWRASSSPSIPSGSAFKVQHAATAGTTVVVIYESTMVVLQVQEATAGEAPANGIVSRPKGGNHCTNSAAIRAASPAVKEMQRVELGGDPVTALGMRFLESDVCAQGYVGATTSETMLIGVASWDSPSVAIFSYRSPVGTKSSEGYAKIKDKQGGGELSNCRRDALENIACWYPPWGEAAAVAAVAAMDEIGGGGSRSLIRALEFIRFRAGPRQISLVAATCHGAVAVAEWQGGECWGQTGEKSLRGTLVTVASFQVGRGPVRLEMFHSAGPTRAAGGGGGGEKLFVNGETMDAVVCRHSDKDGTAARDGRGGEWHCTQVCRAGQRSRCSVVYLQQTTLKTSSSGRARERPEFAWLTTQEAVKEHPAQWPCFGDRACGANTGDGNGRQHFTHVNRKASSPELSLSIGSLDDSEPRGRCFKKPVPWTPTHLLYVPTSRSIVVACWTSGDDSRLHSNVSQNAKTGAVPGPRCCTEPMGCSASTRGFTSFSSLRIFDADTLEERPGSGLTRFLPGVKITGITVLASLGNLAKPRNTALRPVGLTDRSGRPAFPANAPTAAVGGDVLAVACCSSGKPEQTMRQDSRCDARRQDGIADQRGTSSKKDGQEDQGEASSKGESNTNTTAAHQNYASLTTVIAAFELVVCSVDGGVAVEDEGDTMGNMPRNAANGGDDCQGCQQWAASGSHSRTAGTCARAILAALTVTPGMPGACLHLETLGLHFVVGSIDERIVVLGWEGCGQDDLSPAEPAPPLKLAIQASCRTATGTCVTALSTCGSFVAVAEFLHGVSLYRFDESSRVLALVAKHCRANLVVTALALAPPPSSTNSGGDDENIELPTVPLIVLADRMTKKVAMLACPGLYPPTPRTSNQCSATTTPTTSDPNKKWTCGAQEEATDSTKKLRVVSIWSCHETVTSLVATSVNPSSVDSDNEDGEAGEYCGEFDIHCHQPQPQRHCQQDCRQQRQKQRRQQRSSHHERPYHQYTSKRPSSRLSGGSTGTGRDMFMIGTASGAVWTVGVDTPACS